MTTDALSTKDFILISSSDETRKEFEKKKISAIIPVFGIKRQLRKALEILDDHPLISEIILVDDGSTVGDFQALQRLASVTSKTVLTRHIKNLGFSAACNTGINLSDNRNDLLLLNSDSIISKSAISLLAVHSCIEPLAATVGALSNANGFFSIDCTNEMILALESGEDFVTKLLLNISNTAHETVITNNGYVLYITRFAVEQVGLLDGAIYGRGYGEESDFCLRAHEKGLKNVCSFLACGFHQGAGSFGVDKIAIKQVNSQLIRAVHPDYHGKLKRYEQESALNPVKQKISQLIALGSGFNISVPSGLSYIFD